METTERTLSARWALFAVLLGASVARLSTLNDPFTRNHESTACGPMVCAARNLVRYGFLACHFTYVENSDWVDPSRFTFYNHHPLMVPAVMALTSKLFGEQPWCYRLPSAVCSILTSGLLFLMLTRKFDWRIGLTTALIYTLCPFVWLFGDMPDVVGPQLMFFGLLTIECYSRWSDTGARSWFYWAVASWLLCVLCDWPSFFLIPVLCAHFVLTHHYRSWWRVVPVALGSGLILAALLGWLTMGPDKSVIPQLFRRINGPSDAGQAIGFSDWWAIGIKYYVYHTFTLPVMALFVAYVASLIWMARTRFQGLAPHDTTLMMLCWGFLHVLIGFQSSFQHMWVWCVLVPGASAAAALGGWTTWRTLPARVRFSDLAPHVVGALAIVFLVSCYLEARYLSDLGLKDERVSYTLANLGTVIRQSVPTGQGVLTSDIGDPQTVQSEPALWFYADRQLRKGIRSVAQLDGALGQGNYDLFYTFVQHGGPAPKWFVMPCEHHEQFKSLADALDARYPRWQKTGFLVYYLQPLNANPADNTIAPH